MLEDCFSLAEALPSARLNDGVAHLGLRPMKRSGFFLFLDLRAEGKLPSNTV